MRRAAVAAMVLIACVRLAGTERAGNGPVQARDLGRRPRLRQDGHSGCGRLPPCSSRRSSHTRASTRCAPSRWRISVCCWSSLDRRTLPLKPGRSALLADSNAARSIPELLAHLTLGPTNETAQAIAQAFRGPALPGDTGGQQVERALDALIAAGADPVGSPSGAWTNWPGRARHRTTAVRTGRTRQSG